jgi:hypothetical protein
MAHLRSDRSAPRAWPATWVSGDRPAASPCFSHIPGVVGLGPGRRPAEAAARPDREGWPMRRLPPPVGHPVARDREDPVPEARLVALEPRRPADHVEPRLRGEILGHRPEVAQQARVQVTQIATCRCLVASLTSASGSRSDLLHAIPVTPASGTARRLLRHHVAPGRLGGQGPCRPAVRWLARSCC